VSDAADPGGNALITLSKNPKIHREQIKVRSLQSLAGILNIAGPKKLAEMKACIEGDSFTLLFIL